MVFLVDDFVKPGPTMDENTARFFAISGKLPLELQMVLSNRVYNSPRDLVLTKHSKPSFSWLGRPSTWKPSL